MCMCIRVCIPKMPHNAWISPQAETQSARTFLKSVPLENRNVSARKKERVFRLDAIPSCWSLMFIFSFSISNWTFRSHAIRGKSIGRIGHGTNIHNTVPGSNKMQSHIYISRWWISIEIAIKRCEREDWAIWMKQRIKLDGLVILGDVEIANALSQHIRTFLTSNNWIYWQFHLE